MLRNSFRRFTGLVIMVVFGIAIFQFFRQTQGNPFVGGALASGAKLLLLLALVLWLFYLLDRRINRRPQ